MSQTETILLIVLGFSLASLIALFLGRMVWTAAVRVGARRMQRQVPSSLIGLQTERDRLRAEYAMLSQRLGSRLETARLQMAEQMAEVSRHRNRIHEMESAEAAKAEELRRLKSQLAEAEQAIAAAQGREDELRRTLAAKEESLRKLRRKRRREAREAAATPAETAEAAPAPAEAEADSFTSDDAEIRLRQRIDKLSELARATKRDAEDGAILMPVPEPPPVPDDPLVAEKLEEAERQTADLERELEKLDAQWEERFRESEAEKVTPAEAEDPKVISLNERIRELRKSIRSSS